MTEVFGVVGSAVGVAGFAFQIADGIKKLADFCQAVKDAPADLQDALSELVDLADMYKDIGQQIEAQQLTNPTILPSKTMLERLLDRSKRNHKDLQNLLVDLEAEVKKRQIRGSIRAVLKKETFARFQKRVKRTKDTLQISYTVYCNALIRQEAQYNRQEQQYMRTEMQKISAVTPYIPAIADQVSLMAPQIDVLVTRSSGVALSSTSTVGRSAQANQKSIHRQPKSRKAVTYKLRLPTWLHSQVYELVYSYSTNVWSAEFRVYNNVSRDSPFFRACQALDYTTVKSLLLLEPAHVFDQDEYGQTALHYCVKSGQINTITLDLLKLLMERGADVSRPSRLYSQFGETPSDAFAGALFPLPPTYKDYDSTLWGISDLLQFTSNIEDKEGNELEIIAYTGYGYTDFFTRSVQSNMQPPWHTRSLESRLSSMAQGYFGICHPTLITWQAYEAILGSKLDSAVWEADKRADRKLLPRFMRTFGKTVRYGSTRDIDQCRKILQRAIRVGISLTQTSLNSLTDSITTPLQEYLSGFIRHTPNRANERYKTYGEPEQAVQAAITSLATELQNLGLDLTGCGQQAETALRNMFVNASCYVSGPTRGMQFRVVALQYGPQPGDWRLLLSNMHDEYLDSCHRDFWYMIEHPELRIPGAWSQDAAVSYFAWLPIQFPLRNWNLYDLT